MRLPFRPMRSRVTRLLASALVVVALLANGVAVAGMGSMAVAKDCCPDSMGQHHHDGGAPEGKRCPAPVAKCDDQCAFRCQTSAVTLPVVAATSTGIELIQSDLPPLLDSERAIANFAPGLRPPISS